ncbi:MAG TPA: hypothetical protein VG737_03215 [Cyclobacteriaceae bacterium]|nr:hypothetical protein [Cyclobacteriaceae bacterium]
MTMFSAIFNLFVGAVFVVIGLNIYWPFSGEFSDDVKKYKPVFVILGVLTLAAGMSKLSKLI